MNYWKHSDVIAKSLNVQASLFPSGGNYEISIIGAISNVIWLCANSTTNINEHDRLAELWRRNGAKRKNQTD
ncbi:hypothetical protein VCR29J2_990063 [Vibrio coralliirubri]|nr:hypothetical protein VCR29J2_990063 [Vibrio coralliirubri]